MPQPQQKKVQQSSPKVGPGISNVIKDIKTESHVTGGHEQAGKPSSDKEKVPQFPANKKKGQNDKSTSGNGGSLANMWGHASKNSNPSSATAETNNLISNTTGWFPCTLIQCGNSLLNLSADVSTHVLTLN